ncbi:ATP-binding protein (plasmid) [Mycetohabitans endofungorum]
MCARSSCAVAGATRRRSASRDAADLDSRASRGIERSQIMSLALGEWVSAGHCILITGPTGVGKSWSMDEKISSS